MAESFPEYYYEDDEAEPQRGLGEDPDNPEPTSIYEWEGVKAEESSEEPSRFNPEELEEAHREYMDTPQPSLAHDPDNPFPYGSAEPPTISYEEYYRQQGDE